MERINANEVQSMMEAYASVYKTEEQEVISEETQELEEQQGGAMRGIKGPIHYLDTLLQGRKKADEIARNRGVLPKTGGGSGSGSGGGSGMGGLPADYKETELEAGKTAETYRTGAGLPKSGGGNQGQGSKTAPKPNSNVTSGGTKFERRLPTSAELRAAQAARAAGKGEEGAIKAAVGVSKGTVADPKIAADAKRKAELAAARAKAKADTMSKKPASDRSRMGGRNRMRMEEIDIFDTIKQYLIDEGATEEEALKTMITLTDEQRNEILGGIEQ